MKKKATDAAFSCKTCVHSSVPAEAAPCNTCVYGMYENQFNNYAAADDSPTNDGFVTRGQPADGPEKIAEEKKVVVESLEHEKTEHKAIKGIKKNVDKLVNSEKKEHGIKTATPGDSSTKWERKSEGAGDAAECGTGRKKKPVVKTAAPTYVGGQVDFGTGRKGLHKLLKKANMLMGYGSSTGAGPQLGTGRQMNLKAKLVKKANETCGYGTGKDKKKMTKKAELMAKLGGGIPETPLTSNDEPGDLPMPARKKLHAKLEKKAAGPMGDLSAAAQLAKGVIKGTGGVVSKAKSLGSLTGMYAKAHPVATAAGVGAAGLAGLGAMRLKKKLVDD